MHDDEIREAVEQAGVTLDVEFGDNVLAFEGHDKEGTWRILVSRQQLRLTGADTTDDPRLASITTHCISRARPIFAALDLLKPGEWTYYPAGGNFNNRTKHQILTVGCTSPCEKQHSAANLLYRTFGADKLREMYAPKETA